MLHKPELRLKPGDRQDRGGTSARETAKGYLNGRIYSPISRYNETKRELTRKWFIKLFSLNETVGAINEEEQFRTIDSEHYTQWKVIPKIMVAPIQFSGLISKAAEGGEESFAKGVVDALDRARIRLIKDRSCPLAA